MGTGGLEHAGVAAQMGVPVLEVWQGLSERACKGRMLSILSQYHVLDWLCFTQVGVLVRDVWRGFSARALMAGGGPIADKGLTRRIETLALTRSLFMQEGIFATSAGCVE